MKSLTTGTTLASLLLLGLAGWRVSAQTPALVTYKVTLSNLTTGQPFSPPVAATHKNTVHMFEMGKPASKELEAIAEDGDPAPMFNLFVAPRQISAGLVSDVVNIGMPITPKGTTKGDQGQFKDTVTFQIKARPDDRFSFATMLICTNDGFLGLDGVELPQTGSQTYMVMSYDAGTENNTEKSTDIVDACSALGPQALPGDPNGNEDKAVNTNPAQPITLHPGITGSGDLKTDLHKWTDPVAMVTIEKM